MIASKQWILNVTTGTQDSNCGQTEETTTTTEDTTTTTEETINSTEEGEENPPNFEKQENSLPIAAIVGGSAAGLVLIAVILVAVWCWKKGKCQQNSSIVEMNSMYGAPEDDYQYAKDQYDTRVTDNNDYYDE